MRPAPPKQPSSEDDPSVQTETSFVLDGQSTDAATSAKERVIVLPAARRRLIVVRAALALVALVLVGVAIRQITQSSGTAGKTLPPGVPTATPTAPTRPPFFFPIKTQAPAATGKARPAAAADASIEIAARLSTFYDTVFMDPATWANGIPDDAWRIFDPSIVDRARGDADAFTLGDHASGLVSLSVTASTLQVKVLLDPAGDPYTAVADVDFEATGRTKDGQMVIVTNHAGFLFRPSNGLWVVFGYPSATTDVETAPATPSPAPGSSSGGAPTPKKPKGTATP